MRACLLETTALLLRTYTVAKYWMDGIRCRLWDGMTQILPPFSICLCQAIELYVCSDIKV